MSRFELNSKVVILFLCVLKCILVYSAQQDYGVDFERIETVPGTTTTLFTIYAKLERNVKREVCGTGNITFMEDFGNEYKASVSIAISADRSNNFVPSPMKVPAKNFCEIIKTNWRDLIEPSTKETTTLPIIPEEGMCPYPKGTYELNCFKVVPSDKWPNHVPLGLWRLTVSFTKNGDFIGGYLLYLNIYSIK